MARSRGKNGASKPRSRARRLLARCCSVVAAGVFAALISGEAAATHSPSAASRPIAGDTPAVVSHGKAVGRGDHDPNASLKINIGLGVHDSAQLDALIEAASTPGSAQYGHYLTRARYMARYAPTDAEVHAVEAWLTGEGLHVVRVSPDNLLVKAKATVSDLERVFNVQIDNYQHNGREFYANDRDPSVPAGLNINWVSGLSNFNVYRDQFTLGGLDGGDFRTAYDVSGNGLGQTIAFTNWGMPVPQSDFDGYASATGTPPIVTGQSGPDGLDWAQVGDPSDIDTAQETAMDLEVAHAVAPGSHLVYFLGEDPSDGALEDTLDAAANSGIPIISNSWGCDGCDPDSDMDTILQFGAAMGETFFFSSGDNGSDDGPSRPADSPDVIAVGGTYLSLDSSSNYVSETAWSGSGGGCTDDEPRPAWQFGIGGSCDGRAIPDIAADASNGAYVFVHGGNALIGGTSLSAPLWAAFSTIWNNNNQAAGRPTLGFAGGIIYSLANDPTTYANDFHDITSGSNGDFSAGGGWDEVTGWGSPDFNRMSNNLADMTYTGPTSASNGDTIELSATLLDHNASTAPIDRLVTFTVGAESCTGATYPDGHVSCSVTIGDAPGHYAVSAAFAGDAAYVPASATVPFTVLHIPTTVIYTGPTNGDYHDPVTLSATLIDDSNSQGIPGEQLSFSFGAESCSGVTNDSGVAHCTVTPSDSPGGSPYPITVNFAGDEPVYLASSDTSHAFTVQREETTLAYTGPTVILEGASGVTLKAKLLEDGTTAPVPFGQQVTLGLGGQSCIGMTDSTGTASCSLTFTGALGSEPLSAVFAGDTYYLPSSDTGKTAVVFSFPSRGAFVLGDLTVGSAGPSTTVTWWSENWYLLNSLSGGTAPAAFKGFAGTVLSLPTTTPPASCTGTWTTTGGNSPPPTSGVPSYMGVLVASNVTKSGNTISGDFAKIVVVKVDPGYAPNPMSAGTGTIVATFCPSRRAEWGAAGGASLPSRPRP
jgi:kumamolisin